jgi:hypothetical protein
MSEISMNSKKGKNFKEVIEQEKNKGKNFKKMMYILSSIDSSLVYGGAFLFSFVVLDVVIYLLFAPEVFVWTGALVGTALVSSLLASRITNILKKNQWKFKSAI